MSSRLHIFAAVLLTLTLVAVLSSAQDYPPSGRPGGSGRDCYYVCFLDNCTRRKCYYTCNRPRYCEEESASLLLSAGGGVEDGLGQQPAPGDTVDSADDLGSVQEPDATPTA